MARGTRLLVLTAGAIAGSLAAIALASTPVAPAAPVSARDASERRVTSQVVARPLVVAPPRAAAHVPAPVAKAKPLPKPRPRVHRASATAPSPSPRPTVTATKAPAAPHLTAQQRLMAMVAGIPGYRAGDALWSYKSGLDSWGVAVMGGGTVYLSPSVPADKLYSVVRHEWSHILSARDYGNDVALAKAEMNRWFGGTGLVGAERAADCMARLLGATYTVYTQCTDPTWQAGARRLVAGQRL